MTTVTLIGLGIMGAGMAYNLLKAGYHLTVYNRSREKAGPLVEAGATLAASPKEAAADADVIIAIVGNDDSSRAIWLGENGVLAGALKPNAIAVESTTLSLGWIKALHQATAEAGLRFIDSPVTGGRGGAEEGALTLLVGADEATLTEATPVLEAYSQRIIHFGPPGMGTAYKLVVNLMAAAQTAALAEGVALAQKVGLNMEQVAEALGSGAVASPIVQGNAARMAAGDHDFVNFSAKWIHKDAVYSLQMASEVGQAMPLSAVAAQVYQMALSQGLGEKNMSAVIEGLRSK